MTSRKRSWLNFASTRAVVLALGVPLGLWVSGTAAYADTAAATPTSQAVSTDETAGAGGTTVGELVVEATKRDERLKDVPESVAVITVDVMEAAGPIQGTGDVLNLVPGARYTNLADPLNSEITIRGSGTERATPSADVSVGLYFNGVYFGASQLGGRNLTPIDSFDLDHLEVLEGPQGGLYGRDAEYGVIDVIPAQPEMNNSGYATDNYTVGNKQNLLQAVVNYKLNDNWALRIGAENISQSGGFEYDADDNNYLDVTRGYMVRGQLRYNNSNLNVDLLAERQTLQVPEFWTNIQIPPGNTATGVPVEAAYPYGFIESDRQLSEPGIQYSGQNVSDIMLSVDWDLGFAKLSSRSSWRVLDTIAEPSGGLFDLATEDQLQSQCLAGNVDLTSCGGDPLTEFINADHTETWFQDLHFDGAPVFNGRMTWLAGLELMLQDFGGDTQSTANACPVTSTVTLPGGGTVLIPSGAKVGYGFCQGPQPNATIGGYGVSAPYPNPVTYADYGTITLPGQTGSLYPPITQPGGIDTPYAGHYFSWAPYASLGFDLGAGFKLQGSARYSSDQKAASENSYNLYSNRTVEYDYLTTGQPIGPVSYALKSSVPTWTVDLSWKIPFSPWDDMLYAKVGTGYRVGGFNYTHSNPELPNCNATTSSGCPLNIIVPVYYAPIKPSWRDETSISYEGGFKGDITSHAYVTLDGYITDTSNALASVSDGCAGNNSCLGGNNYTENAGTTHGWGVEAQMDTAWTILDGKFTAHVEGSTQEAHYVAEIAGVPGLPLVGSLVAENPKYLAGASASYTHSITENLDWFFNLGYHGQWGGIQDPQVTAGVIDYLSDYQDVNIKTGFHINKAIEAAFVVTNLTNEVHDEADFGAALTNTISKTLYFQTTEVRLSPPRTIGFEASYKW